MKKSAYSRYPIYKWCLQFVLLFTVHYHAIAQESYTLSGNVIKGDRSPVAHATVMVKTALGETLLSKTTDASGTFSLTLRQAGDYLLEFSAVGMDSLAIQISINEVKDIQLPDVMLSKRVRQLEEVQVTAQKPRITMENNKLVYHVTESEQTGFTTFELLRKVPGIVIDGNNNILLKGQSGVKVMINNKMVEMSASDLNAFLQSKTASDIDNVEIISNPPAQYDAAGSAGIININLKRIKANSFNGTISSTFIQGKTPKYNNALNLSYQANNLSMYATAAAVNGDYQRILTSNRILIGQGGPPVYFDDQTNGGFDQNTYSFNLGGDYNIGKHSNAGLSINGNFQRNRLYTATETAIARQPQIIDSILRSSFDSNIDRNNVNYGLFYSYRDDEKHVLLFSVDYGTFGNGADALQPNAYFTPANDPLSSHTQQLNNHADIDIYATKLDLETPVLTGTLAIGWKSSWVNTKNTSLFQRLVDGGFQPDDRLSNQFNYKESIHAGYLNYHIAWKRIDLQVGLRAEQTRSTGILIAKAVGTAPTENQRSYLNLFPSGSINLKVSEKNTIGLSYSRRIDRPNYQTLNPFEYRLSELISQKGNPYLRAQYTDKIALTYMLGSRITTGISYSYSSGLLNQLVDTLPSNEIQFRPINLGSTKTWYYDMSYNQPITGFWQTNAYFYVSHYQLNGQLENGKLDRSIFSYYASNNHEFTLSKAFTMRLSGYIVGPFYYGAFRNKAVGSLDVSLQYKVFGDRGAITFNGSNILNTNILRNRLDYGGVIQNNRDENENRLFRLSLTYRFNSNKQVSRKYRSGMEEERRRTN